MVNERRNAPIDSYPQDSGEVPLTTNRRYWGRMSRSARMVTPDVLELTSYYDKRLRMLMALFLLMMVGIPFASAVWEGRPLTDPVHGLADTVLYVFSPEHSPRMGRMFENYGDAGETFSAFVASHVESMTFWDRFRRTAFAAVIVYWCGILALLATVLFSARRSPVWFDRKRREVRTWRKGRLYVERLDQFRMEPGSSSPGHPLFRNMLGHGPLLIWLHDPDNPEDGRAFWTGTYPPTNSDQNADLWNLVRAFADSSAPPPGGQGQPWLARLRRRGVLPLDVLRRMAGFSLGPDWARPPWPDVPAREKPGKA